MFYTFLLFFAAGPAYTALYAQANGIDLAGEEGTVPIAVTLAYCVGILFAYAGFSISNSGAVPEAATSASAAATAAFPTPALEYPIPECDVRYAAKIALPVLDAPTHNKLGGQIRLVLNLLPRGSMIVVSVLVLIFGILLAMRIVAWRNSRKHLVPDTDNTDDTDNTNDTDNAADLADANSRPVSTRTYIASADSGMDGASVDFDEDAVFANTDVDTIATDSSCTTYADAEKLSDRMTVASLKEVAKAADRGNEGATPCIGVQYGPQIGGSIPRRLSSVLFQTPVIGRSHTGKAGPTSRQYGGIEIVRCSIESVNSGDSTERSQDRVDDVDTSLALYHHLNLCRINNAGSGTSDVHSTCKGPGAAFRSKSELMLSAPGVADAILSLDAPDAIQAEEWIDADAAADDKGWTLVGRRGKAVRAPATPAALAAPAPAPEAPAPAEPATPAEPAPAPAAAPAAPADSDNEGWTLVGRGGKALRAPRPQESAANGKPTRESGPISGWTRREKRSSGGSRWR